jgi:hypothetical protein
MIDFVIALRSPAQNPETGPLACRSEKTGRASRSNANTKDFLWSGLTMKTSELARISRDFRGTTSGFLCTSDYLAERTGFEPFGTGLKAVRTDFCVSYAESGASRILCDYLLAAESSLTGGFPKANPWRFCGLS